MNGTGGTYDCVALMAYYVICKSVTNLYEIEEMEGNLFLPAFRKLKFVNVNKPFFKRLLHFSFATAGKKCLKWNDYKMNVAAYQKGKPIYYEFTECPVAEFAKQLGCLSVEGKRKTTRYKKIEVEFQDAGFVKRKMAFAGFVAQIIQHEVDHCNGVVI